MKIRTQLILAFLLLSVVPLSGIVLYSYVSSQKAVRVAQMREAEEMAKEMDRRVAQVRDEVTNVVADLGELPLGKLVTEQEDPAESQVAGRIVERMGDAAPFVESIEFVPALPEAAVAEHPLPHEEARTAATPVPAAPEPVTQAASAAPVPATSPVGAPEPPSPPSFGHPDHPVIVINIDELMRDVAAASGAGTLDERSLKEMEARLKEAEAVMARAGEVQQTFASGWDAKFEKQIEDWEKRFETSVSVQTGEGHPQAPSDEQTEELRNRTRMLARAARQAAMVRAQPGIVPPPKPPVTPPELAHAETKPSPQARPAVTLQPLGKAAEKKSQTKILFGKELQVPVRREGSVVGELRPRIRAGMLIQSILGVSDRGSSEIPFAIDSEGMLWAANEPARETVQKLGITYDPKRKQSRVIREDWVVATSRDEESGLQLGIARPIGEPLAEVRRTATRNFAYGLGLIGIALIGIIPLANHMTRDITLVTHGAERIAQGDLETEVPVRSTNELGALATAFNRMAHDLRDHQSRLVEEERRRKDEEIQRHLLSAEFDRKTRELEDARAFQLALLPKQLPQVPGLRLAVHMRTATEVGGDYYDFHVAPDGALTVAVGDATGHGARAGTMVTVVKSLFSAYHADRAPGAFLSEAGETVRRMDLGRMAMALQLARIAGDTITLASAAMPPVLLYRAATRNVEELAAVGMPLGSFGDGYPDITATLESGDTLLMMSDGFPELLDRRGDPLGYVAVENAFLKVASQTPDEIIAALAHAADERTGGEPPNDDITFVVVKVA